MLVSRRRVLRAGWLALAGVVAGCGARATRSSGGPAAAASSAVTSSAVTPSAVAPNPSTTRIAATASAPRAAFVAGPPAVEVSSGPRSRAEVALTFHGAGDPALARDILAILRSAAARATVLVVGSWLSANRSLAAAIAADGHELGNHTWSHPTLIDLPEAPAAAEITRCRDLLIELTGSPGAHFRQSGSQHSSALIRRLAGAAGYPVVLSYDLDSLDWTDPPVADIEANLARATAGSIVSMHLGHAGTVAALPGVLAGLRRRGLTPVTATRLLS